MHSISTVDMTRQEWLKVRQQGIGGSDVAAILGLSKYKTPLQVYEEKVAPEPIDREMSAKMEAGIRLEDTVAQWWADDNGFKIQKDNKIRFHSSIPFLFVNLDRIICANGNGRGTGILEVKCTGGYVFKKWEDDGLPLDFYAQVQHQFNCTGHDWGAVATLVDGWNRQDIDIKPDPEFIEMMNERLTAFWNNHIVKRIPPEPSTNEEIKRIYPKSIEGKAIEATEETVNLVQQIRASQNQHKFYEEQEDKLKVQLKSILGDSEFIRYQEQILATYRTDKSGKSFDKKQFGEAHPDLLEKYTVEKPGSRRLLIKEVEL